MGTYTNYSKLEVDGTISSSVQGELIGTFTSMPSASALNEGKTIYYTGATSGNFVQNTFYTCTKSGSTYSWTSASPKQVSVDSALSETSTNPVQNKVIANALKGYAKKDDISTVYKPMGSIASANLPTNPRVGDVYDLTDASSYGPAGTNVVYTENGWDALSGITDISGKQDKLKAGTGISIGADSTISLATSGVTAGTTGSATNVPVITVDAYGRITSISTSTIYPPTSAGTSGQIWVSDGSGQGVWQSKDTTPTSGSTNAITSGAVYSELAKKQNNLTFDSAPTASSSNPVTSGGVYTALQAKQNNLTFDSTPTNGSSNPVTSGGVYSAINNIEIDAPTRAEFEELKDIALGRLSINNTLVDAKIAIVKQSSGTQVYTGDVVPNTIPLGNGVYIATITQFGNSMSKEVVVLGDTALDINSITVSITPRSGTIAWKINNVNVPVVDTIRVLKGTNVTIKSIFGYWGDETELFKNDSYTPDSDVIISGGYSEPKIITKSGQCVIPMTTTYQIVLTGGGGGGNGGESASAEANDGSPGAGRGGYGGNGGYVLAKSSKFTQGQSISVTIGEGGTGGDGGDSDIYGSTTKYPTAGGKGGTTIFGSYSAEGGKGGSGKGNLWGTIIYGGIGGNGSNGKNMSIFGASKAYGSGGNANGSATSGQSGIDWLSNVGDGGNAGSDGSNTGSTSYHGSGGGYGGYGFNSYGKGGNGGKGGNYTISSGKYYRGSAGGNGSNGAVAIRAEI